MIEYVANDISQNIFVTHVKNKLFLMLFYTGHNLKHMIKTGLNITKLLGGREDLGSNSANAKVDLELHCPHET